MTRSSDLQAVAEQLGREPTTQFEVVARCPGGRHPLVIRNHPVDRDGNPFPTLYWLTCPEAVAGVSRLESEGWIARLDERVEEDPECRERFEDAALDYAAERERLFPGAGALSGVGGSGGGIKCLHAHYAHHLAGGANPIGAWVAERVEPIHEEPRGRVAAVDMGTNSIRLLVADPKDDDVVEISRDLVITRLGQDVDRTKRLDPVALDRTIRVLERYARRARALRAYRIRVGATSAVRDASNRERLFAEVARVAGASAEVLTGEREAELSFLGATADAPAQPPYLVFDIGGGSTEFAFGTERPEASVSLQLGSVRTHERVKPEDLPTAEELAAMDRVVEEALAEVRDAIPSGAATLVGVAGTTTTVQGIALGLDSYDPEALHGSVLSLDQAERVSERLASMTVAERAAIPVMTRGREDVIVAGSRILLGILRTFGFDDCLVSERDILDGLAIEMVRSRNGDPTR
ncbi:MAG TPA: DUF501 domain-containing protein [Actinomycetota bacterium]